MTRHVSQAANAFRLTADSGKSFRHWQTGAPQAGRDDRNSPRATDLRRDQRGKNVRDVSIAKQKPRTVLQYAVFLRGSLEKHRARKIPGTMVYLGATMTVTVAVCVVAPVAVPVTVSV